MGKERNELTSGQIFYELFIAGNSYREIAKKYGRSRNYVAARIFDYRKANNLKPTGRSRGRAENEGKHFAAKNNKVKLNGFTIVLKEEAAARKITHKGAYRREDGVLVCPVRYCEGYGYERGVLS